MGQKQTVRPNLRQSRRRKAGVSQTVAQPTRTWCKSLSLCLLLKLSLKLFGRHTAVLWLVVAALLIGTTSAAVMTIVDPTASISPQSEREPTRPAVSDRSSNSGSISVSEPQPAASTLATPVKSRSTQSASPISAGSLLLLSCAGGCFLLSQWLKPQTQPFSKRSSTLKTAVKTKSVRSAQTAALQTVPSLTKTESTQSGKDRPILPESVSPALTHSVKILHPSRIEEFSAEENSPQASVQPDSAEEVMVTVLPEEQSHPLDWDEPSLADNLDLRQRRPLSYWL